MRKFFHNNDTWLVPLLSITGAILLFMVLPFIAYGAGMYVDWVMGYLWP